MLPTATMGVDVNGDGWANYAVTGMDMNRDGIPDALQRPMGYMSPSMPVYANERRAMEPMYANARPVSREELAATGRLSSDQVYPSYAAPVGLGGSFIPAVNSVGSSLNFAPGYMGPPTILPGSMTLPPMGMPGGYVTIPAGPPIVPVAPVRYDDSWW
jgi:hypothetical protein